MNGFFGFVNSANTTLEAGMDSNLEWKEIPDIYWNEFEDTLTLEPEDRATYLWVIEDTGDFSLFWEGLEQTEVEQSKSFRHDNVELVELYRNANVLMNEEHQTFSFTYSNDDDFKTIHFEILAAIVFDIYGKYPVICLE